MPLKSFVNRQRKIRIKGKVLTIYKQSAVFSLIAKDDSMHFYFCMYTYNNYSCHGSQEVSE